MAHYSILDLVPITAGSDAACALERSQKLAMAAEGWGYNRYWVAEHHNMPGIASSATAVVIAHLAAATKTIRVGSGGIMLPNHAPLIIIPPINIFSSILYLVFGCRLSARVSVARSSFWQVQRRLTRAYLKKIYSSIFYNHELRLLYIYCTYKGIVNFLIVLSNRETNLFYHHN